MRKTLKELLSHARENAGLKQCELADLASITPAYLSQIESGQREPSLDVLRKLADALGCELLIDLRCHASEKKSQRETSKTPRR